MLKVLQLIPTLDRSGAEKQMVLLATGLPRDRFRVEVATLTRLGPLEAELRAAQVPVTALGKRFKLDPLAFAAPRPVPPRRAVRRDPDLDLRGQHLRPGGGTAGTAGGGRHGRDGRRPLEESRELAIDRWLAQRTDRVVGNSQAVVDFYRRAESPPNGWP